VQIVNLMVLRTLLRYYRVNPTYGGTAGTRDDPLFRLYLGAAPFDRGVG
jgi:hypothetical protein